MFSFLCSLHQLYHNFTFFLKFTSAYENGGKKGGERSKRTVRGNWEESVKNMKKARIGKGMGVRREGKLKGTRERGHKC